MPMREYAEIFARYDDHRVDRPHARQLGAAMFGGHRVDELIDAAQPFEVGVHAVHEQRVQCVTCDLRETGIGHRRCGIGRDISNLVADTDDENAVGTEMHRRTQRRRLPHRAVAEVLVADADRRKNHGYGDTRHQVIQVEVAADTAAARPRPFRMPVRRIEE